MERLGLFLEASPTMLLRDLVSQSRNTLVPRTACGRGLGFPQPRCCWAQPQCDTQMLLPASSRSHKALRHQAPDRDVISSPWALKVLAESGGHSSGSSFSSQSDRVPPGDWHGSSRGGPQDRAGSVSPRLDALIKHRKWHNSDHQGCGINIPLTFSPKKPWGKASA